MTSPFKCLILGSDHGGWKLKQELSSLLFEIYPEIAQVDISPNLDPEDDFPVVANDILTEFLIQEIIFGVGNVGIIGFCSSGNGINIALNRNKLIRSINCKTEEEISLSRQHLNINGLCFSGCHFKSGKALKFLNYFLFTEKYTDQKYIRRIKQISS